MEEDPKSHQAAAFEFVDCNSETHALEPPAGTVSIPKDVGGTSYSSIFKITRTGSAKYGFCKLCSKRIKYSNKGSLKQHLKSKHPEKLKEKLKKPKPSQAQKHSNTQTEETYDSHLLIRHDSKGNRFGECQLCSKRLNIKNRNTTAVIMRHLNVKHPSEYKKCLELTRDEETSNTKQSSSSSCKEATYFNIIIVNKMKYGECRLCTKIVKMKYGNTTGLKRHLLAKHKKEHKTLYGQVDSDDESNNKQEEVPIKTEEPSVEAIEDKPDEVNVKNEPVDVVKTEVVDEDFNTCNLEIKVEENYDNFQVEGYSDEMDYSTMNAIPQNLKQSKQSYDLYYIIMNVNEDKMAICRFCCRDIKMKNSNTTGLKRHLQAKHPEQYKELFEGKSQRTPTLGSDAIEDLDQNFFSFPSTSSASPVLIDETKTIYSRVYSQHYTIITPSDNARCGICRLCSKCVKMTSGNTSGLKRHLKSKHPQQFFETFYPKNVPPQNRCFAAPKIAQQDQTVTVELFGEHSDISEKRYESSTVIDDDQTKIAAKVENKTSFNFSRTEVEYERQFATYFIFSASKTAECRLCMESIPIDENLKALRNHLKLEHPQQHNELFPGQSSSDDMTSTYVVAIYSGSESDGEDENGTVTLSLRVQKKYSCYYTMSDENGVKFGICRLCTQMIKMKKSNTSGLRRHLKSRHPQEYTEFTGEELN